MAPPVAFHLLQGGHTGHQEHLLARYLVMAPVTAFHLLQGGRCIPASHQLSTPLLETGTRAVDMPVPLATRRSIQPPELLVPADQRLPLSPPVTRVISVPPVPLASLLLTLPAAETPRVGRWECLLSIPSSEIRAMNVPIQLAHSRLRTIALPQMHAVRVWVHPAGLSVVARRGLR